MIPLSSFNLFKSILAGVVKLKARNKKLIGKIESRLGEVEVL